MKEKEKEEKSCLSELRRWAKGRKKEEVEKIIKEGKMKYDKRKYCLVPLNEENTAAALISFATGEKAEPAGQMCTFDFTPEYTQELLDMINASLKKAMSDDNHETVKAHLIQDNVPALVKLDMILQAGGKLEKVETQDVFRNENQVENGTPGTVVIFTFKADGLERSNASLLSNSGLTEQEDGTYKAEILMECFKKRAKYIRGSRRNLENRENFIITDFYARDQAGN